MNSKIRDWLVFLALGLTWGSSFLWIKIAVGETAPITVVSLRLLFGWAGMLLVGGALVVSGIVVVRSTAHAVNLKPRAPAATSAPVIAAERAAD